jgi:hypothetical protein
MHASHKNGSRDSDKAPCNPGFGGKFVIPGSSCLLGSSFGDRRAHTSVKGVFSHLLENFVTEGSNFLHSIVTCGESWFHHFHLETKQESTECHHTICKNTKLKTIPSAHKTVETAFRDVGRFFPTSGMLQCYLLPTDVPETSSCTAWQTSREENDHPATWQHMTPQCLSVQGEDSEEQVETFAPSTTLHSRPNPPRLPSFQIHKG